MRLRIITERTSEIKAALRQNLYYEYVLAVSRNFNEFQELRSWLASAGRRSPRREPWSSSVNARYRNFHARFALPNRANRSAVAGLSANQAGAPGKLQCR